MWPYYPDLLDMPVPRYTSYPTAAEFRDDVGPRDYAEALNGASGDISLYVHIPFCESICWYCACNTGAANRRQRLATYLDSLHHEIALVAAHLPRDARVRRVAFGGGSPNAISPVDFVRLFSELVLHFSLESPEVSIELDPRTLSPEWGSVIAGIGATHASMGVQTFAPHLQKAIGRIQPLEAIQRSVALLRDAGITSLNFDLMYGLPGQSDADLEETLRIASAMGANRIALFGYAHVPHLIARQRRIDGSALPSKEERFMMAQSGYRQLTDEGYDPIGFDHFALPGDPLAQAAVSGRLHRNFQGFTDDAAPVLIGLGASAIGNFPDLLVQNEKNSGRYRMMLSQDILPAALGVYRSEEDQRRGQVIEALLCHGRASMEPDLARQSVPALEPYLRKELCAFAGNELTILPEGLPYARSIASQFDPYRQHSPRRFSSAI
ncbi:oxygen-independent coproporphyrinogen III oxidase [Croceicoccus estronivorus]|uniref:oxygen-independent coproporphyrinogen III oxidase n=1 Tax=Croceicoccus estronivorus TaxID=1172626 RepID=UPI000829B1F8|nr:oxygen-independent coproporphyrinogen III oxidase [Croceicoccus estronivorus]OCC22531.1 oxygen-independent coproporphyrinogen III oxidase [Croceicoccus estronivorus]